MMHAPMWWYLWLGVVLVFGLASMLRRRGGRQPHVPKRHVHGRPATCNAHRMQLPDWNGGLEFSDEFEHASGDHQVMAADLGEGVYAGRYAMALASHEPSFSPGAPVSSFDAGGPAHMDA